MPNPVSMNNSSEYKAYVITGPTSGIGRAAGAGKVFGRARSRRWSWAPALPAKKE
jgi:hypothetical protein